MKNADGRKINMITLRCKSLDLNFRQELINPFLDQKTSFISPTSLDISFEDSVEIDMFIDILQRYRNEIRRFPAPWVADKEGVIDGRL